MGVLYEVSCRLCGKDFGLVVGGASLLRAEHRARVAPCRSCSNIVSVRLAEGVNKYFCPRCGAPVLPFRNEKSRRRARADH